MAHMQAHERIKSTDAEQRISMTYAEYLTSIEEFTHAEWANGEAIVFMPPNTRHQRIVNFLYLLLGFYLQVYRCGELFVAPYAMQLAPHVSVREPALLFIKNEHAQRIGEQRKEGPADLVIEVISTESASRDRSDKFYEYQAAGVTEYWLIDPRPGFTRADFWVLDEDGRYRPVPVDSAGSYSSTVLPNFNLDVTTLLAEPLPEPMQVAFAMIGRDTLLRALGND